ARAIANVATDLEACERSLAATRATRARRLADRIGLDADELALLWFAVAMTADPLLAPHAVALAGAEARLGASLALYATVEDIPPPGPRALSLRLGPTHPLFRYALGERVDGARVPALAPFRAARRVCRYLAGDDALDEVVGAAGGLIPVPEP